MRDHHAFVEHPGLDYCGRCGQSPLAPVHREPTVDLLEMDALGFAAFVASLGAAARDCGLRVPGCKGTPGGPDRTITRYPAGPLVTVRMRGRPAADVKRDLVAGVIEANDYHHDSPQVWEFLDRMEDA